MDWSAVYDNSGEEEGRWEDHGETRSSRNAHRLLHRRASLSLAHDARLSAPSSALEDAAIAAIVTPPASSVRRRAAANASASASVASTPVDAAVEDEAPQYSPLVAYAFTVNYILGVGSLGIPYAFYRAGLLMGNVLIAGVTLVSYITVMWVAETVARAREALRVQQKSERSALLLLSADGMLFDDFPEVTQMCATFLGRPGAVLYQLSLLGLMYGGLVGYSQVFVNSFVSQVTHVGGWAVSSAHAAVVFACIVVPLSCSDLTEQIHVQLAMSVVRFAALAIMISSALYAIFTDPVDSGASADASSAPSPPFISAFSLVNLGGFGVMFSTGVFSQLFQHSVPGLLAPLGAKNQEKAGRIFGGTLLTTMLFYMALGSVCSLYFGAKVSSSVNLNWADFSWGFKQAADAAVDASPPAATPLWARALSMLVVIFPALDTLSVFPLISVTLGDNMAASVPHAWRASHSARAWSKLACRFAAAVPPLLIAVFVSDLSLTLQLSGVAGVYVAFFAPAMLQLRARRAFPAATVYSSRFSSEAFVYAVLAFGAAAFLVLVAQLVPQMLAS